MLKANRKPQSAGFRGYCPKCLLGNMDKEVKQLQKMIKLVDHQPVQTPLIDPSSKSSRAWSCTFVCDWVDEFRKRFIIKKEGGSPLDVVRAAQSECQLETNYKGIITDDISLDQFDDYISIQISIRDSCSKNFTSAQSQRFSCVAYSAEIRSVHVANHYHDGWFLNNYTVPVFRNRIFRRLEMSSGSTMQEAFGQLMSNKQYGTLIRTSSSIEYTKLIPVESPEEVCIHN